MSRYASLASKSKGRQRKEQECKIRTCYQRDRDRILHCNSFKRLKHKTQVFLSPKKDHYSTRLIHSLEVSQIARTVARSLRLNEDLTEAVALGHDLGHAPFGHVGENILNEICPFEFTHAQNSVRVVKYLEKNGMGLNLTYEVIDGIRCHSKLRAQTMEGRLVQVCDKVAYVNHDIEDSLRAGVIENKDLPEECVEVLGKTKSERLTTIVYSLIQNSKDDIKMSKEVLNAHLKLKEFMFDRVYLTHSKSQKQKARDIIEALYIYYLKNSDQMPEFYINIAEKEGKERAVCDYISGMTDNYAVESFKEVFIPKQWNV